MLQLGSRADAPRRLVCWRKVLRFMGLFFREGKVVRIGLKGRGRGNAKKVSLAGRLKRGVLVGPFDP